MRSTTLAFSLDTTRLFEPDTVMPDQFYATLKKTHHCDPELRLMSAILEDAVSCLSRDPRTWARHHRKSAEEAEAWINTEGEEDWIFSFTNVCETLGLDPSYLRGGLHRWTATNRSVATEPCKLKKYRSGSRQRKMRFRAML